MEKLAAVATFDSAARRFVAERFARGELTEASVRTYRGQLALFARLVGPERPLHRITRRHVERWLEDPGLSEATRAARLSAIASFYRWATESGLTRTNPTLGVHRPPQPRKVPRGLRKGQVARALKAAPDTRGRAILLLMAQEGLRAIEVAQLQVGDVDLDEAVMVVKGKGRHERVLPVSDETAAALRAYLDEEPSPAGPLIRSRGNRPGRALPPARISFLASEYLHEAGIRESGHSLRHTAASDMLRAGANLRDVQAALGHASLGTTQRYLGWSLGDLRKAMGGRSYGSSARPGKGAT